MEYKKGNISGHATYKVSFCFVWFLHPMFYILSKFLYSVMILEAKQHQINKEIVIILFSKSSNLKIRS